MPTEENKQSHIEFNEQNLVEQQTPVFSADKIEEAKDYVLTTEERYERIVELSSQEEGGWKPIIAFLPEVSKAQAMHKIDAMIADWTRLQRHWKKIDEAANK